MTHLNFQTIYEKVVIIIIIIIATCMEQKLMIGTLEEGSIIYALYMRQTYTYTRPNIPTWMIVLCLSSVYIARMVDDASSSAPGLAPLSTRDRQSREIPFQPRAAPPQKKEKRDDCRPSEEATNTETDNSETDRTRERIPTQKPDAPGACE